MKFRPDGAATTANDFLQSWRFLHHAIGLKSGSIEEVVSARVKGAADGMFSTKRKLVQAAPLTTKMVLALEKIVLNGPYIHWRLIAGHLLLCLGSSSRFADSIRLDNIMIDEKVVIDLGNGCRCPFYGRILQKWPNIPRKSG